MRLHQGAPSKSPEGLHVVKRLAMLCMLFVALGFATAHTQAREFQVVDIAFTPPRPVPGAAILAIYEYQATNPVHSATFCSGVELTRAGPDGRFTLTGEGRVHINAHQVGFSRPSKGIVMSKGQVFLRPDGSLEESACSILPPCSRAVGAWAVIRIPT